MSGADKLLKVRALRHDCTLGDETFVIPFASVRRFGKWKVYGRATQFTVGEYADCIVYIPHAEQEPEVAKILRKRLKGVFANNGNGSRAVADAFGWEARPELQNAAAFDDMSVRGAIK